MNEDRERLKQILSLEEQWVFEEVLNYVTRPGYSRNFFEYLQQLAERFRLELVSNIFLDLPIMKKPLKQLETALGQVRDRASQVGGIIKQEEAKLR